MPVATFTTQENSRPQIKSSGIKTSKGVPQASTSKGAPWASKPAEVLAQINSNSDKTTGYSTQQHQHVTEWHIMTFRVCKGVLKTNTTRTIAIDQSYEHISS